MKNNFRKYRDQITKKFKNIKLRRSDNHELKEVIDLVENDVIEVNASGSIVKVPLDKIVMIKKKALQTVFYLISNEKIVSNFRFEDLWVLLPSHIFEKSNENIIFQKAYI